jgi:hypothetical protein
LYCEICGNDLEYNDEEQELGSAFKICLNCIILGPDKPGIYVIPKGTKLDHSVYDRNFAIVRDEEIPMIFQDYFDQVIESSKKMNEKYALQDK